MQTISITPRAARPRVTLTSAAAGEHLRDHHVPDGGCSGFSYEMFFDSQTDDNDTVEEFEGVRLAVDNSSMEKLGGAEVDYRDSLEGAGFHISNPNINRSCGCGNSFS